MVDLNRAEAERLLDEYDMLCMTGTLDDKMKARAALTPKPVEAREAVEFDVARATKQVIARDFPELAKPEVAPDDEALMENYEAEVIECYATDHGKERLERVRDALRRHIAGLRARVFDLETQADDRRHENNALRNTNDLLSEVIEEADDEVELIQDLICAPMEKKRAKGIAIRDYIQSMRARAEAAERELAGMREAVVAAEKMFRWYGDLHAAKEQTPDNADKTKRNYDMADQMARALKAKEPRDG